MFANETRDRRSEGLLLIRAYPNEEPSKKSDQGSKRGFVKAIPVWTLDAGRQRCTDTGSGTHADSSFKHRGCVADTSCVVLANESCGGKRASIPNLSSLVHTVLGGSITRLLVKSP